jgi:hypothetical protein
MFASITHIPSLHKILSNMPKHKLTISTSSNIIRHETVSACHIKVNQRASQPAEICPTCMLYVAFASRTEPWPHHPATSGNLLQTVPAHSDLYTIYSMLLQEATKLLSPEQRTH